MQNKTHNSILQIVLRKKGQGYKNDNKLDISVVYLWTTWMIGGAKSFVHFFH